MVDFDFLTVTWGYVIMRLAMVGQWLRAAASDSEARPTALRFAAGIAVVQVLWLARIYLLDDTWQFWTFFVLVAAELAVPVWAESHRRTNWHPHHIAERFGLFTLLLLGESLLASANAMFDALDEGEHIPELLALAGCGIVVAAGMWWLYFAREQHGRLRTLRSGFTFGYLHYVIFAAAGAVSAGVEVEIDSITGHTEISHPVAGLALTVPIALFVLSAWALLLQPSLSRSASASVVVGGILIALSGLLDWGEYGVAAVLLVAIVVVLEADARRRGALAESVRTI
jgi:low temperature requirement protein LtrA